MKVPAPQLNSPPLYLPSSSPEPGSPPSSSLSLSRTRISSGGSISSTPPSPRVQIPSHPILQSDARMLSAHGSDDILLLSSEESSEVSNSPPKLHHPFLQRERAFWKPNMHDNHPDATTQPCCNDTSSSALCLSDQHFQVGPLQKKSLGRPLTDLVSCYLEQRA